ncbi:glucosyltransferase domain-containing protein [Enterobacter intestinihominis]|jgi:hypothetical protein|uniref:glucosyltransferase domain-containing protein n=2 Tax=Enterobacteriaceae TaxID=543 RepID=UPI002069CC46|nr:MAG TPA: O-antigen conversion protein C [Caudoviricetes sp.]HCJ7334812.1 glucosyltransferase domain-containing protein [Enterobacter hormaechei subsp. xiangfangensis]HCT5800272.1 glucosyltransferase domain-containing protein [Enterobacter hormaechei]HDS9687527.1 glucosyltransferase domain-containing protein [Enterobacter hormaechei subsp. oharae]HCT5807814.1 glucosyltransferase domain-containing protein [Enterobacter hormaechei]
MNSYSFFSFRISAGERKFVIILSLLLLVYIIPIILADRLYIDDILRSQQGYKNWGINGRPLADLIMAAFNFTDGVIADASPLGLFYSTAFFLLCSLIYYRKNLTFYGPLFSSFAMFLVFSNPFMLENLSYKFDVIPMVASLSILFIPYSINGKKVICFVVGIICIVSSLSLYQASIGFFCSLALVEMVTKYTSGEQIAICYIKSVMLRVIQLIVSYIIYSFISSNFVNGDYNIEHSQMIGMSRDALPVLYSNASVYISKIHQIFTESTYVFYFVVASSILSCIYIAIPNTGRIKGGFWSRASLFICIIAAPVLAVLFSFIHLSLLKYPVFADRVLISFGGAILFYSLSMASIVSWKRIASIILIPLVLFSIYYSYVYGNAMKYQKEYDDRLSNDIANVISNEDKTGTIPVYTYGKQPSSLQRTNAVNRFQSLDTLVPLYYVDGWWGTLLINMYGIKNKVSGLYEINQVCSMRIVSQTQSYSIYKDSSKLIIDFSKHSCH